MRPAVPGGRPADLHRLRAPSAGSGSSRPAWSPTGRRSSSSRWTRSGDRSSTWHRRSSGPRRTGSRSAPCSAWRRSPRRSGCSTPATTTGSSRSPSCRPCSAWAPCSHRRRAPRRGVGARCDHDGRVGRGGRRHGRVGAAGLAVTIDAAGPGAARRRAGVASGAERAVGRALRRPRPVVPRRPALGVRRPPSPAWLLSRVEPDGHRPAADLSRPGRSRARGRPHGARACASGARVIVPWCSTTCRPRPSSRAHSRHAAAIGIGGPERSGGDPPFDDLGDELDPGDVELLGDAPEVRVAKRLAPHVDPQQPRLVPARRRQVHLDQRERAAPRVSRGGRSSGARTRSRARPSRRASPRSGRPWCRSGSGSARCSHRARRPRRGCAGRAGPWPA